MQVVILIMIVAYALYHVANNAHAHDTDFGRSKMARVIVFVGVITFLISLPVVPIDVELEHRLNLDSFRWVWMCILCWQLTFIWIVCPLSFAFYGTNDKDTCCRRLWDAFRL